MQPSSHVSHRQSSERLAPATKFLFALGAHADSALQISKMLFLMFFYTELYKLGSVAVSGAIMIGTVWDAVTDPVMGVISDRTRTRFGRRRPYILIAAFGYPLAFILLWLAPRGASTLLVLAYLAVTNVLLTTMLTIGMTPYSALSAELTLDYDERNSLYAYRQALFHLGALVGSYMIRFVGLFGGGTGGFRGTAILYAAFASACFLLVFWSVRERKEFQQRSTTFRTRLILEVFRNRGFRVIFFAMIIMWSGAVMSNAMLAYIVRYWHGRMEMLSYGYTVWMACGVLFTPLWRVYGKYADKKLAFGTSVAAMAVLYILSLVMITPRLPYLLLLWAGLVGAATPGGPLFAGSMIADAIDFDELHSGMRREGIYSGIYTFAMKMSVAIGTLLVGVGLKLVGYVPGETQTDQTIQLMRFVFAFPAVTYVASSLYIMKYPLVRGRMRQIRQQLDARRIVESTDQEGPKDTLGT